MSIRPISSKFVDTLEYFRLKLQISFTPWLKWGEGYLWNLTSQLLVNIYMNEFDQFVKKKLKVKYYIRYVDDFVILQMTKYLQIFTKISDF